MQNYNTEFKGLIDIIISRFMDIMSIKPFQGNINSFLRRQFVKSMEKVETQLKPSINFIPDEAQISFINEYVFQNLQSHADEIGNQLRQELQRGILNKETPDQLKKRVQVVFNDTTYTNRLKTVMRTEKLRANNAGAFSGAEQAKEAGVNLHKYLHVTNDDRTTNICHKEDSKYGTREQAIPLEEEFVVKVGSSTYTALYPPFHVNCRSVIRFTRVSDVEEKAKRYGHKYIRRTGSAGHYEYEYPGDRNPRKREDNIVESQSNTETLFLEMFPTYTDVDNKLFNNGSYWDTTTLGKKLNISLGEHKEGGMAYGLKVRRIVTELIFDKYGKLVANNIKEIKTSYDRFDNDGLKRGREIGNRLYELGKGGKENKLWDNSNETITEHVAYREKIINNMRTNLNNDTKEINKALKYMGWKERVTKAGKKQTASSLTREEIVIKLRTGTFKGVSYKISPTFVKNSEGIKTDDDMKLILKNVIDSLPKKGKNVMSEGKTKLHFITRQEAKKVDLVGAISSRAMGYYNPRTKQIFIFPPKGGSTGSNISIDKMKTDGYDDKIINRIADGKKTDSEKLIATTVHESAHAMALNDSALQEKYDNFLADNKLFNRGMFMTREEMKKADGFVSRYAMVNTHEDFAETFSFYAMYRGFIKGSIRKKDTWIDDNLKKKFEFMETIWQ